jgi:hypothetical protein
MAREESVNFGIRQNLQYVCHLLTDYKQACGKVTEHFRGSWCHLQGQRISQASN